MATAQVLSARPPGQPDIDYAPDYAKYVARTQKRIETENLPTALPPGFPTKLESDLVWEGKDIAKDLSWSYELNDEEVEEIEQALAHFKCESTLVCYKEFL